METISKAHKALTLLVCAVFLTVLFLLQPAAAKAQWTAPDVSGNIYNTNTNNVGIGTTGPNYKFDITNALDRAQVRFGMGASDTGGYLYSGGPSHAVFSAGAAYNSGWIAKSLSASMIELNVGGINFYTNNGISTGSPFTPTNRMTVNSAGVGIGTTTPQDPLHLFSTTNAVGTMRIQGGSSKAAFIGMWEAGQMLILSNNRHPGTGNNFNTSVAGAEIAIGSSSAPGDIAFYTSSSGTVGNATELMRISSNGKVGIGTTAPGSPLTVITPSGAREGIQLAGTGNTWIYADLSMTPIGTIATGKPTNFAWSMRKDAFYGNDASGPSLVMEIWRQGGGVYVPFIINPSGNLILAGALNATNANVGVGTTTPAYKLDVSGSVNSSGGLCIAGDCKTAWSQVGGSQWTTSGTTINYGTGNVGIGVASPGTKLDVNGTVNATGLTVSGSPVVSSQWATSGTAINYATGNVGVATTAPTEKLHVTGNVKITGNIDVGGNINAKYQDMAEWVDSPHDLAAGTVVVLDSTKSNQVVASTQSYDSRVAGVISLRPGLALGERGEGRVLVATTGRVKVKVDATNGPIQIGDLLVTSDREGVAMKSTPVEIGGVRIHRPGTLIGKALEPLAQGTGEILVLLSLQ